MTRSKLIKMLQSSAAALTAMEQVGPSSEAADTVVGSQAKVNLLQVILQILESLLEEQALGATTAELQGENTALFNAVTDLLSAIHVEMAKSASAPNVDIGGVQINILQLIIQIIQAILAQNGATPQPAPAPAAAANTSKPCPCAKQATAAVQAEAFRPLLTSDSVTYGYDTLGRLHTLTYLNGTVVTYNYDVVGNRTSVVTTCGGSRC